MTTLRSTLGAWFAPLLIHNLNQTQALNRAVYAKQAGVDNPQQYGVPYPGNNNTTQATTTASSSTSWLPAIAAALVGACALAGGLSLAGKLSPTLPVTTPVVTPVTPAQPPAGLVQDVEQIYDGSKWVEKWRGPPRPKVATDKVTQ